MRRAFISVLVVAFTILFTTGAYAEWVLYDNFDNYTDIDEMKQSGKWNIGSASANRATFSIESGRLKIVHPPGSTTISAWAELIQQPNKIKGIRTTMEVESWDGDVRARIGSFVGFLKNNPNHQVWYEMALRHFYPTWVSGSMEFVRGYSSVLDASASFAWQYDLFYTELGAWKHPVIAGTPYEITAKFDVKNAYFEVNDPPDLGKVNFSYVESISKLENPFIAIGTRSATADGTCVVYIDDVYIYR